MSSESTYTVSDHEGLTRFAFSRDRFPVFHGFFARTGGCGHAPYDTLNTAYVTKDPDAPANRSRIIEALGLAPTTVWLLNPCHGARIAFIDEFGPAFQNESDPQNALMPEAASPGVLLQTDAAFTNRPGTAIMVGTADCIPAVLTDDESRFVGIAHLGWRNLVSDFTECVVRTAVSRYGTRPEKIRVGIGPSIYPCCYRFENLEQRHDPRWRLHLKVLSDGMTAVDLISVFRERLIRCGIQDDRIAELSLCTGCLPDLFFSCYRDGYISGRFPSLVHFS